MLRQGILVLKNKQDIYNVLKTNKYDAVHSHAELAAGKWLFGKKNVESGKVYILKNAIDLDKFGFNFSKRKEIKEKLKLQNNFVVGHVGRFSNEKNHK